MNYKDYLVNENTSIIDTMKIIDKGEMSVAFVCDEKGRLVAAVSDGDIRRHIINKGSINNPIKAIANYSPLAVNVDEEIDYDEYMRSHYINALPIIDNDSNIQDIIFLDKKIINESKINIPVVIMAGGKGKRLKPYTEIMPKPLIPIGKKTITEHIISRFMQYGCRHFDMIVNYKKNFIKSYFYDCETDYDIDFIDESEFLGTAGGLKLIDGKYKESFFLTNCDILIEADYKEIYDTHINNNNVITLVCAEKKVTIPYGTVELNKNNDVVALKEKPEFEFITNTGLYVISQQFIGLIPQNKKIDITDVIDECIKSGLKVGTYIVKDSDWLDMGQFDEMENMKKRLGVS